MPVDSISAAAAATVSPAALFSDPPLTSGRNLAGI